MAQIWADLETIPEINSIEPLSGIYDLLVTIETPFKEVITANWLLTLEWIKNLCMLKSKPLVTKVHVER